MSAQLQAGVALVLALGLHVAAFALRPQEAGAVAAGAGGADLISLQAADASLAELISEWDRPPTPEPEPLAELTRPAAPDTPPPLVPVTEPALPQMPAPEAMALPQMAEAPLTADVSLPPPAPEPDPVPEPDPEPEPQPRPKPKPAQIPKPDPKPKAPEKPEPAEKPAAQKPSAGQTAQRAAGAGGGAQAGDSGTAQAATQSKARINDLTSAWGASIRSRVERRKSYPSAARGASGTVTVRLTVSRSGQLAGVSVAKSSGHPALDQAAVKAVQSARKFPAAPKGLTDTSYSFTLAMDFVR